MARRAHVTLKWTPQVAALIAELERHDAKFKTVVVEQHYSEGALAKLLMVSPRTVKRAAERGWIGYVPVTDGKRVLRRFPASEVLAFLRRRFVSPKTDSFPEISA